MGWYQAVTADTPSSWTTRAGEDWPSFLGPRRDGKSTERGLRPADGNWTLPVRWTLDLGTGYGACSLAGGRCFVFDRVNDRARLRCRHAESGHPLWEYSYRSDYDDLYGFDNGPRCSPVVDGELVYVYGAEGQLHGVRVSDGSQVWSLDTKAEFGVVQNFFGVGSTPIVYQDLLLVIVGGSPPESQDVPAGQLDRVKPDHSCIVGLNKKTGEMVYRSVHDLASYASIQLSQAQDRPLGFVFARNGLWWFEPATGNVVANLPWRAAKLESVNASTPVAVGDEVFITESYEPGAAVLAARDGELRSIWQDQPRARDQAFAAHWMTPIHVDGFLYGCSGQGSRAANIRCIEWGTGRLRWQQPDTGRASLLYVDGHFVSLSEHGQLELLQATPSEYRAVTKINLADAQGNVAVEYPAWSAPVLSRGLLYVRGKRQLVCAELIPAGAGPTGGGQ